MAKELQRYLVPILLSAAGAAVTVSCLSALGLLRSLEWSSLDLMFRLRRSIPPSKRVALVVIDEPDIARIGSWPVPDAVLAEALEKIQLHEPRTIGIDLYRDLPVGGSVETLNRVLQKHDNIFGVEKILSQRIQPSPALAATERVGFAEVIVDRDRTVRRTLLTLRDRNDGNQIKSSFAVHLALHYLAEEGVGLEAIDPQNNHYRLGRIDILNLTGREYLYHGESLGGYQILANWCGRESTFPVISFADILDGRFDPESIRDRIVIIGTVALSTNDLFATPYVPSQTMPGVTIHADFAHQLVAGALEGRPASLLVLSQTAEWGWIGLWSIVAAAFVWRLEASRRLRRWPLHTPVGVLALGSLLVLGNYAIFRQAAFVLPTISPLVAIALGAVAATNAYKKNQLTATNAALAISNAQLQNYSKTLEERVRARTEDLARARDAATAASQAKSQFLAHMSHELRTPLNAILGYAQLLERQPELPHAARQKMGIVRRSGEHLLQLINDVLSVAKIEAGQIELHPEDCDLWRLLRDLEEMLALKATSKGITLTLDLNPQVPNYVRTDAGKLRQIVLNLLGNAIKFTERGCVVLKVRWREGGTADGILSFAVIDTGPGIAASDLEQIFEPFTQAENARDRSEGTGLGLAISRRFVRLFGGELTATSKLGSGSTFYFEVPVALSSELPATEAISIEAEPAAAAAEYRVLIVDDDNANAQVMTALMTEAGVATRTAGDGREAVAIWEDWQPHLIWMDLAMPHLDGYAATQQIRARDERVAIVALTAHAFAEERERALISGCDDLISKPYQEKTIFQTLSRHLHLPAKTPEGALRAGPRPNNAPPTASDPLAELKQLHTSCLLRLQQAVELLDIDEMLGIVEGIARSRPSLGAALTRLVEDFHYEKLGNLLQAAIDSGDRNN